MKRRELKYFKRHQKRQNKRDIFLKEINNFDNFADPLKILESIKLASKNVRWKYSVQQTLISPIRTAYKISKKLYNLENIHRGFIEFNINERGKNRHIRSVHFSERIVQKSLCKNILYPLYSKFLIKENCASQKGKGSHYAINLLKTYLQKYYKENHTNEGYVLLIDFKSYFDNIDHNILKQMIRKYIYEPRLLYYIYSFIDDFGIKGLGLGSETSQMHSIFFPNDIDHYIKEKLKPYYDLPYDTTCMHEFVLSGDRQKADGVHTLEIAKRLIDGLEPQFPNLNDHYILQFLLRLLLRLP